MLPRGNGHFPPLLPLGYFCFAVASMGGIGVPALKCLATIANKYYFRLVARQAHRPPLPAHTGSRKFGSIFPRAAFAACLFDEIGGFPRLSGPIDGGHDASLLTAVSRHSMGRPQLWQDSKSPILPVKYLSLTQLVFQ